MTFDEAINRREHEDKVYNSKGGVQGLSREIRTADKTLRFDDGYDGVQETIHSMIVADRALFITTRDGHILCLRDNGQTSHQSPVIWKNKKTTLATSNDAIATATAIVAQASSERGIAIVAGLSDGALTKALIMSSQYHVVVFDDNRDRIQPLRTELEEAGMYGTRANVIHDDLDHLSLPPYITTTLISERDDISLQPLLQTLRPYGGIAVGGRISKTTLHTIELDNFVLESNRIADRVVVRRVGPLPGTTQYAGDFSASADQLVRFPLGVLWFDDTLAHFKRSPQPVFDQGTMISQTQELAVAALSAEQ